MSREPKEMHKTSRLKMSLGMIQSMYKLGVEKLKDDIMNESNLIKLVELWFELSCAYKFRYDYFGLSNDMRYIKSFKDQGEVGAENLARIIIIHYLGSRYRAESKEIADWVSNEFKRIQDKPLWVPKEY